MRNQSSRKIMGTPFWLFIAPVCLAAMIANRKREPLTPKGERDTPVRDWEAEDICLDCDRVTLHVFLEFVDEPVVESECQRCKVLRVHEDRRGD
jgi:hypothetical protein